MLKNVACCNHRSRAPDGLSALTRLLDIILYWGLYHVQTAVTLGSRHLLTELTETETYL